MEWIRGFGYIKPFTKVSFRLIPINQNFINYINFSAGGPWLITDMRRGESMFEIDLNAHEEVERGFETEGSNLSGVSARCSWIEQDFKETNPKPQESFHRNSPTITPEESNQIRTTLQRGLRNNNMKDVQRYPKDGNPQDFKLDELRDATGVLESTELLHTRKLEGLHLTFNLEAGSLLPLAIRYIINIFIDLFYL